MPPAVAQAPIVTSVAVTARSRLISAACSGVLMEPSTNRMSNGPDERFRHLFGVLHAAQAAGTAAVAPGVHCEAIDRAARAVIEADGYGDAFFHRTGHGIGLEGHEDPYLVAGNAMPLAPGMAFSVEPGIYFPGEYGARIEDIVVCGEDGPIVLNQAPRALSVVDG